MTNRYSRWAPIYRRRCRTLAVSVGCRRAPTPKPIHLRVFGVRHRPAGAFTNIASPGYIRGALVGPSSACVRACNIFGTSCSGGIKGTIKRTMIARSRRMRSMNVKANQLIKRCRWWRHGAATARTRTMHVFHMINMVAGR